MTFLSTDNNGSLKVSHAQHSINDLTDANDSGKAVGSLLIWDGSNWANYNRLSCQVYRSANLSVPTSTPETLVTFDSEDHDFGAMHSVSTNTSRIVAPETGVYLIAATITFDISSTGNRYFFISKNAAGSPGGGTQLLAETQVATASPTFSILGASIVKVLSANDYIELFVYQNRGSNLNLIGGATATNMSLTRIA